MEWRHRASVAGLALMGSTVMLAAGGCDQGAHPTRTARPARATAAPRPPGPPRRALTKVFDTVRHRYAGEILGICMGAIDQGTSAVKCYGKVGPGAAAPAGPGTLFQIGSLSKTFTATLLALHVKAGTARLDDPVRRYMPAADGRSGLPRSMTLLDLADHYSGLPRSTPLPGEAVHSLDRYLAAASACEATPGCTAAPPGSRYSYSNYAYGVLGELLGVRDGFAETATSAWEKDNDARIAAPLGLRDTHSWFGWRSISAPLFDARRARPAVPHRPPYFPPAPFADAAAGLYSSANDMLKWLGFSMGRTGTPELAAARPYLYDMPSLLRPREDRSDRRKKVGLAWRVDQHGSGASRATCVYKDGLTRGFTASMIFVRGRGAGAFVLLNAEPEDPATPLIARDVVNSLPSVARAFPHACGAVP